MPAPPHVPMSPTAMSGAQWYRSKEGAGMGGPSLCDSVVVSVTL